MSRSFSAVVTMRAGTATAAGATVTSSGFIDGALFCSVVDAFCSGFAARTCAIPLHCGIAARSAQQLTMQADAATAGNASAAIHVAMMKSRFTRAAELHGVRRKFSSNARRFAE
jgi:hypothetical protein